MRPIQFGDNCYLVEWKYKDFLRMGHDFQGNSIVKLEKIIHFEKDYVRVTVCGSKKANKPTI